MTKKKQSKTDKIEKLLSTTQKTNKEIANKLGCSASHVWKVRKEFNKGQTEPEYHTYNDEREKANNTTDTWTRSEILTEADKYVSVDRAATHGDMEDNFREIAELWTQYTESTISPLDVSVMTALLKIARLKFNPDNIDNWVDACGYLACGGELIAKVRKLSLIHI